MASKRIAIIGDMTTTGGRVVSGHSQMTYEGTPSALLGDSAYCPKCNSTGKIIEGAANWTVYGSPAAYDGCLIACGCPIGTNRIIAAKSLMFVDVTSTVTASNSDTSPSPSSFASGSNSRVSLQNHLTETVKNETPAEIERVFAKSCTVGEGCSDAAAEQEPSTNFGTMLIYNIVSAFSSPANARHPSMLPYCGNNESNPYSVNGGTVGTAPVPVIIPTLPAPMMGFAPAPIINYPSQNIKIPTPLDNPKAAFFVSGALLDSANSGKPFTSALMGMMIAELFGDDAQYDEQALRDLAEIRGYAKTRVRFFFERDENGQLVAKGLHTVAGTRYEEVRVRRMDWSRMDSHYEFSETRNSGPTIIWTPARPEGSDIPTRTDYPAGEFNQPTVYINPIHELEKGSSIEGLPILDPKDFNDYILVFPADSGIPPIYVYFSQQHKYHESPGGNIPLLAFPTAVEVKGKTFVQGGGKKRTRWKDKKGKIYEWDYQHGAVEMYNKLGKHLGEYDHITGEQLKPADPKRRIEP